MLRLLVAIALFLAWPLAARSAAPLPTIPHDLPYAQARTRLIAQGLEPVRVYKGRLGTVCGGSMKPCYPELLDCLHPSSGGICDWLYERRSDGSLIVVRTGGITAPGQRPYTGIGSNDLWLIQPYDLDGYVIATADGKGRYEVCHPDFPSSGADAPPCSATSGKPCMPPSPPAGARPPPARCPAPIPPPRIVDYGPTPHVRIGTPYPDARAILIRQGFDPVRIVSWDTSDHLCFAGDICAVYREILQCAADEAVCEFLYRRRSDQRYWLVGIRGETDKPTIKAMRGLRYDGARPATDGDVSGLEVIAQDGRRLKLKNRQAEGRATRASRDRMLEEDAHLPLCDKLPPDQRQNCWIKPPAGYRPPY